MKAVEEKALQREQKKIKRAKMWAVLTAIWSVVSLAAYFVLDYWNIVQQGWTASNITVTFFLFAQLAVAIVFPLIGSDGRESRKKKRSVKRALRMSKKIILKSITITTTVLLLLSIEGGKVDYIDILKLVFTILTLLVTFAEIVVRIVTYFIKKKTIATVYKLREDRISAANISADPAGIKSDIGRAIDNDVNEG